LDLKECSRFSEWPTAQGGRWGLFIAPTLKESLEESFTRQGWWTSLEADRKFLEVGPITDKSGGCTGQVWCRPLEAGGRFLEAGSQT
jgi:hypothetical protein